MAHTEIMAKEGIAIIGMGCVLPDAPDVPSFWANVLAGKYSITEVPSDNWKIEDYYHPDPKASDKTYCKIGGFVRGFTFNSMEFGIPPKVAETMDNAQKWALVATRQALQSAGYLDKPFARDKTAVILGNALGGDNRVKAVLRVSFPEMARVLQDIPEFATMSAARKADIWQSLENSYRNQYQAITEDTMPGALANVVSGRIANVFNLSGANYTTDAACASSLAALQSAVYGLWAHDFDIAVCGGSDHSMTPDIFIMFSKIGALSPDQSCPFDESANGFVMGEGAVVFVLKRLSDAERDKDKICAVIRGIGSSSDGKGKSITAPSAKGQVAAIIRACGMADISPATIGLIEAHGTSTIAGDATEIQALKEVFAPFALPSASIAIGSVKSQIGHLKSCAGAVGLLKVALSLHHKMLPPSINIRRVNSKLGLENSPFFVNAAARQWEKFSGEARCAGLSSFGFGGTNFHVVVAEYRPQVKKERLEIQERAGVHNSVSLPGNILVLGASDKAALQNRLRAATVAASTQTMLPSPAELASHCRLAIAFKDAAELKVKGEKLYEALARDDEKQIFLLRSQGAFVAEGKPGKIAFLFPGQGSQYLNMGKRLCHDYPIVAQTWDAADRVMASRLEKKLSAYVFVPENLSPDALRTAEEELKFTKVTQPAVLTLDIAMYQLLQAFGIVPDMAIGHSLGEYAALVAAGVLSFDDALIAASGRAKEMSDLDIQDRGLMASVFAEHQRIEKILAEIPGYVVCANINSPAQTVIGGETKAVVAALEKFNELGIETVKLSVSHAFHTKIVAPAAPMLRKLLETLVIHPASLPVISNVSGRFYPQTGDVRRETLDLLEQHVVNAVQFITGVENLYQSGARIFIEAGPKKALTGLVSEILGQRPHVALYATHPKKEDRAALTDLLAAMYAQGIGQTKQSVPQPLSLPAVPSNSERPDALPVAHHSSNFLPGDDFPMKPVDSADQRYLELGRAVGRFFEQMQTISPSPTAPPQTPNHGTPLVISGVSLGLPGRSRHLFAEDNFQKILAGQNFIESLNSEDCDKMCRKNITRLVKRSQGDPTLETLISPDDMAHLAGMSGIFDVEKEFGLSPELAESMDRTTQMGLAAGILALRDAGLPLILHYRKTSTGSRLPSHWALPKEIGDDTGVIFASAFSGDGRLVEEVKKSVEAQSREQILAQLDRLLQTMPREWRHSEPSLQLQSWRDEMKRVAPYQFPRKFILSILPMGSSQLAQWIGARGPNTHINSACASTSVAIGIAHDWIRAGRCRRVIVIAADDPTTDTLREWILSGFLALGAATSEKIVEKAALPFDRRRNGLIAGMGAAGLVLEQAAAVKERGMRPITELLGIDYANSAFHVSRLDTGHIQEMIEKFVAKMEKEHHLKRLDIAHETMFMSHETYTPARGGSASAEVESLRAVFGAEANSIVVANTKGFTGHAMGAGVEEVVAVRSLQFQQIPPVANFRESDPELGTLNLSHGGHYPVRYALKFAAGFGSQATIALLRRVEGCETRVADSRIYDGWLKAISGEEMPELEIVHKTLRIKSSLPAAAPKQEQVQIPQETARPSHHAAVEPAAITASTQPTAPTQSTAGEILQIVSQKTGYPVEMLELELDLEADLGIDTVKQAEVFASIREKYRLPRKESLQLRDYPTLKHLVAYVTGAKATPPEIKVAALFPPPAAVKTLTPAVAEVKGESLQAQDSTTEEILQIVSRKTGYPVEMLNLELDLEADLGIDTVKQAEVFATIREKYHLPRKENLQLRDYPTLKHLIAYVTDNRPSVPEAKVSAPSAELQELPQAVAEKKLEASGVAAIERMMPQIVPAQLTASTQARSFTGKTVVITADGASGTWEKLAQKFTEAGAQVLIVTDQKNIAWAGAKICEVNFGDLLHLPSRVSSALTTEAHVCGLVHLLGLRAEPDMQTLELPQWKEETSRQVKSLFVLAQALQADLEKEAGFVVAATRMGGTFGMESFAAKTPISGGISGLTKALAKEMPQVQVKLCDFVNDTTPDEMTLLLWEEITANDRTVEVCFPEGIRSRIEIVPFPLNRFRQPNLALGTATVFVVSGGARGITAEVAKDLAQNLRPKLALLGQVVLPDNIALLAAMSAQELETLKIQLHTELSRQQSRVTPVLLAKEWERYTRAIAVYKNIESIKALGADVSYHVCDVADETAVQKTIAAIAAQYGKIDVLLHGAGLEESKALAHKKLDSFDKIFDVKSDGIFNLLRACQGHGLKAAIFFSSVAARFGNLGQTDYAAANDLLNKYAAWLNQNTGVKALAIGWSGWDEVGMAARENIRKIFSESGITLIPPSVGAPLVREELLYADCESEIVIAGNLGFLDKEHQVVTPEKSEARRYLEEYLSQNRARFPLLDQVVSYHPRHALMVKRELTLERDLYLSDHAIEGVPVLPGVMGLEMFAEAAKLCYPKLEVVSIEQIEFAHALKIFKGKPVSVRVVLREIAGAPLQPRLSARLESDFFGPQGQKMGETRLHFAGVLVMGRREQSPPAPFRLPEVKGIRILGQAEIYQKLFHGPLFQVCREAHHYGDEGVVVQMKAGNGSLMKGTDGNWQIQPLMLELAFQAAGLYDHIAQNRMGLPSRLEKIAFYPGLQSPDKEIVASVVAALDAAKNRVFHMQILHGGAVLIAMQSYATVTPVEV
jgi:acyl transferase domain-containing protein/NAD(P)-dependent dehydrogenase (short-subunit alcohol dehydrogenase family)